MAAEEEDGSAIVEQVAQKFATLKEHVERIVKERDDLAKERDDLWAILSTEGDAAGQRDEATARALWAEDILRQCSTALGRDPHLVAFPAIPNLIKTAVARLAKTTDALTLINKIRVSIVGRQSIHWSLHIYPLVAILDDAGFFGEPYDVARPKALAEVALLAEKFTELEIARNDATDRADKLRKHVLSMKSYLGHVDQDANHEWMVKEMREALDADDVARNAGGPHDDPPQEPHDSKA